MTNLPNVGDVGWGTTLNTYIENVVLAEANQAETTISSHIANSPPDPHGDRAYAQSLISALNASANGANGFLRLDAAGGIPASALSSVPPRTSTYDVVARYIPAGTVLNGSVDVSSYIQQALDDAHTAGGGEVWLGDGNYGIGSILVVYASTWLHLAPGASMTRILGTGGTVPKYMLSGYTSGNGSSVSGQDSIVVSGGTWNYASQTGSGAAMAFAGNSNLTIEDTTIVGLEGQSPILLAGCTGVSLNRVTFGGAAPATTRATYNSSGTPAVRIENITSALPSGLPPSWAVSESPYYQLPCSRVSINDCEITASTASDTSGAYTWYNGIAGTMTPVSGKYHTMISVSSCRATGIAGSAILAANWQSAAVVGNLLNVTSGSVIDQTWTPAAPPAGAVAIDSGNTAPSPSVWQDARPLATGFNGSVSGNYPPQYRAADDGSRVELYGGVGLPASGTVNNVSILASPLPSGYRPGSAVLFPAVMLPAGIIVYARAYPDGSVRLFDVPSTWAAGSVVQLDMWWPVPGTSGLIPPVS